MLFADICDSTPLYETSGDAPALAAIAKRLDELAQHAISYGGEVVRSKGDDVLCTFTEPSGALHAAARMLESPSSDVLPIRVGIHFGDVIAAREDIFGDAVNVAARMLSLAKPGELVTSSEFAFARPPSPSA